MNTKAVACYNKDDKIRMKSSSGGVFYLLAKYVIENGGVVFGAKFNKDWEVIHSYAETLDGISDFMGSKYVQSSMGNTYKDVLQFLKQDRLVLFSGTPCQVYGLKAFLGKNYDNLITVDFVCHGVPSKKVWRKYINSVTSKSVLTEINMRDKSSGWSKYNYSWKISYKSGEEKFINQHNIPYMRGFTSDYYLRPSCYKCCFKGTERISDFTLGDYWGIWEIQPDMDDDKGTSLILIHTEKGIHIFETLSDFMVYQPAILDKAVQKNPSIVISSTKTNKRAEFFQRFNNGENFEEIIKDISRPSLKSKIKGKIKKILSKV
ncbi:MAG: Coenzyme F420 hydrogenase/dehydrogenase, beta subunit C-terminal domain [Oscillospiraceae bacterium]